MIFFCLLQGKSSKRESISFNIGFTPKKGKGGLGQLLGLKKSENTQVSRLVNMFDRKDKRVHPSPQPSRCGSPETSPFPQAHITISRNNSCRTPTNTLGRLIKEKGSASKYLDDKENAWPENIKPKKQTRRFLSANDCDYMMQSSPVHLPKSYCVQDSHKSRPPAPKRRSYDRQSKGDGFSLSTSGAQFKIFQPTPVHLSQSSHMQPVVQVSFDCSSPLMVQAHSDIDDYDLVHM